jgi:hypothetical protein
MLWQSILAALMVVVVFPACVSAEETRTAEPSTDLDYPDAPEEEGNPAGEPAARIANDAESISTNSAAMDPERTGEAALASAVGDTCRAACAAGYAALCLRVQFLCAGATAITVGTATVPCVTAIAVACIGSAAVGAVCTGRCQP